MTYPIDKYRFVTTGNKVIAISTYAGRTVRGVAKCDPRDTFDIERGKRLAAARCAVKVGKKRVERALKKRKEAKAQSLKADAYAAKMNVYVMDAYISFDDAKANLKALESEI